MDHSTCYASVIPKGFILSSRWFLLWVLIKVRVKALNDMYGTWYLSMFTRWSLIASGVQEQCFQVKSNFKTVQMFFWYTLTRSLNTTIATYRSHVCDPFPENDFSHCSKSLTFYWNLVSIPYLLILGGFCYGSRTMPLTQPSMCSNKRKSHCLASFPFVD